MEALKTKILGQVQAANGSLPYADLADSLDYSERRKVIQALRSLEADGKARRLVARDNDTGAVSHNIILVGGD